MIAALVLVGLTSFPPPASGSPSASAATKTPATTIVGGVTLARVPRGSNTMGSPVSEPGHDQREPVRRVVIAKDFWMSTTEITQGQYALYMTPGKPAPAATKDLPVVEVSWDDAVKFCQAFAAKTKRKVRLPTEAEWEYACRGGASGPFAVWVGGKLEDDLARLKRGSTSRFEQNATRSMNFASNGVRPVGKYPANAYGLRDMHGNVWEWCQKGPGAPDDAPGLLHRPIRGGGWVSRDWKDCRSAKRAWELKDRKKGSIGFRIVVEQ